jgi:hypothetical protein
VLGVFGAPPDTVFPKARDAAIKALAFDAQLAEPHVALGHFKVQHPAAARPSFHAPWTKSM